MHTPLRRDGLHYYAYNHNEGAGRGRRGGGERGVMGGVHCETVPTARRAGYARENVGGVWIQGERRAGRKMMLQVN